MISTLFLLLPVFALILAGYVCRRRGVLGATAAGEINRFVVWLAMPALMFDIMAHTSWEQIYQPAFFWTFILASALVFIAVLAWRTRSGMPFADACIDATSASYPNTGFVGFPLLLLVFGQSSLVPTTIASVIAVCVIFAAAIALIEAGLQADRHPGRMALKIASAVGRNPLVVSPVLGALCSGAGVPIPASAESFLKLLGAAASPCALVGLGLFLANGAGHRPASEAAAAPAGHATVALLAVAKLAIQPALIWLLATSVFALPANLRDMAILLAALPTGTGPFMLAEYYRRDGRVTSNVILVSTAMSVPSLGAILYLTGLTAGPGPA